MTYEEIVAYAKKKMADVDVTEYKGHLAVQVNITGEGEGAFYVELNDSTVAVEPYEYYDRDAVLIATADVFNALVDGKKDAVAAYLAGELAIEGDVEKAQEFGNILKNKKKKAAKKAPAKKAVAKKAPAKKETTKKETVKKETVKKAPAKKETVKKETVAKPAATTKKAAVATAKKAAAKKAETK